MKGSVAARLLGLTVIAAALALGVRQAALALVPSLARPLAEVAAHAAASTPAVAPSPASSAPPSVTASVSIAAPPPTPRKATLLPPKKPTDSGAKAPLRVTQAELDEALASRCGGASTRPVRDENGKVIGLALHGVGKLGKFGVQDGDRLVSANGLPLRTPDEALAALGALQHETKVVFVLQRGAAKIAIAVELGS
ncbi:MAG: hypothetical protein IPJ34_19235 [Myxococcales bacterium]|nr:hypothetical protein [Myxococcales bacterium]